MAKYVSEFFNLNSNYTDKLLKLKPNFGYNGFGEIVFYRTYSRIKADGTQENWHDVVLRVINGTFSIRKDWYKKNFIQWDEDYWQRYAYEMATAMFKMHWLPAGRGLWAMGTPFVFERGSMALNNCGFTVLGGNDRLSDDLHWMMDALMLGVGVGFHPVREELKIYKPVGEFTHYVQDSREGWAESTKLLVDAFTKPGHRKPKFKYDFVRKAGLAIKGFGGLSSGPEPLMTLHNDIEALFETQGIDPVRLKTDIGNKIGVCVVAGNVRRSAELCEGDVQDELFLDLKDYDKYPEREDFGYMSNNSVMLERDSDYDMLGEVAKRVVVRGEPGVINLRNFKYGRVGKPIPVREDKARGLNPCGEIPLEDKELCNVVETLPTACPNVETWYKACEYATFYASTVSLLPTHREETNRVVVRNRRIGVGIIDWTGWVKEQGLYKVTSYMRKGYDVVTKVNQERNSEAGVPESLRKTTIKPGGTTPKLKGKTPGIGNPTFGDTLRRMSVAASNPICPVLDAANVPYKPCFFDPERTRIYEYPIKQGPSQPAEEVSLWEQAMNLVTVQREWSDNSVSNTLYFKPKWKLILSRDTGPKEPLEGFGQYIYGSCGSAFWENAFTNFLATPTDNFTLEDTAYKVKVRLNKFGSYELRIYQFDPMHEEDDIEKVLSAITPLIKACSLLPHSAKGAYRQMPEEGISAEEYETRLKAIKKIDWAKFCGSDGIDEKFCQGASCELPFVKDRADS